MKTGLLIPVIRTKEIMIRDKKAFYSAYVVSNAGQHNIVLDKSKTDTGRIQVSNPEDRMLDVKITFLKTLKKISYKNNNIKNNRKNKE